MSKRELLDSLTIALNKRAWTFLDAPVFGAAAVYFQKWNGLILLAGIEFSRVYKQRFTCSLYLSRSFHWAYILPGFPNEAFRRIGNFITYTERTAYFEVEFCAQGVIDAWWIGFNNSNRDLFLEALDIAKPRFLGQNCLAEQVLGCVELQRHVEMCDRVRQSVFTISNMPVVITHQPARLRQEIDLKWYWAAEVVLREYEPKLVSRKYVELLAVDAWRHQNL